MRNRLAAVCFGNGQDIDGLFDAVATAQIAEGKRVAGALQKRGDSTGECHCSDMDLETIGSGRVFRISQPLGQGSKGCRLHPGALVECSAFLQHEIEKGCDLLVLNRFGKGESEGRGFRDLISAALEQDTPVLLGLRSTYLEEYRAFSAELGVELPFDKLVVQEWLNHIDRRDAA